MDNEQKEKMAAMAAEAKKKAVGIWTVVKEKIVTTWKSGRKGKAICIGGATAILLLLMRCGGGGAGGGWELSDDDFPVVFKAVKEDEGVVYRYYGNKSGITVLQATKKGNLVENDSSDRTVWVETDKRYENGEKLGEGFYIRRGSMEYENALGAECTVARYVEVTDKGVLKKIRKQIVESEGKPFKVDAPVTSLCGFAIGATPNSVKSLFKETEEGPKTMGGTLVTPFRHFEKAYLEFRPDPRSGGKHLASVSLRVGDYSSLQHWKEDEIRQEVAALVAMLEKKFGIKFQDPDPFKRGEKFEWKSEAGNDSVKQVMEVGWRGIYMGFYVDFQSEFITPNEKEALRAGKTNASRYSADAGADLL